MIPVARLNHAVLYVRDAQVAADFYGRVFGFEVVSSEFNGRAVFMRAGGGENHHDLGLFSVGPEAPRPPRGSTGLYHLAWEVPTIEDLASAARELSTAGALGGAPAGILSRAIGDRLGFTPLAEGLENLGLTLCTTPDCDLSPETAVQPSG